MSKTLVEENHDDNNISSIYLCLYTTTNILSVLFPEGIATCIALTIARSSSNSRQPVPSNLSKSMRPFHRTHTPFIMKCDSMWTCVGKDKSTAISYKCKQIRKYSKYYVQKDDIIFFKWDLKGSVRQTFTFFRTLFEFKLIVLPKFWNYIFQYVKN